MIVYYDQNTFEIRGMSNTLDPNSSYPWIETDQPLATDIFLGKEKLLKYVVVARPNETRGVIKLKPSKNSVVETISDRIYKVPKVDINSEIKIIQNVKEKTIEINILNDSKQWWINDAVYSNRRLHIVACIDTPYHPLWIKSFNHIEFENTMKFNYIGKDDFVIFSPKIFGSYSHEITSR